MLEHLDRAVLGHVLTGFLFFVEVDDLLEGGFSSVFVNFVDVADHLAIGQLIDVSLRDLCMMILEEGRVDNQLFDFVLHFSLNQRNRLSAILPVLSSDIPKSAGKCVFEVELVDLELS